MQFDVYENENPASRQRFPYLLDVQAELLDSLGTRVIIPLVAREKAESLIVGRLMPVLTLDSRDYVAFMPQLAGVGKSHLGARVGNLSEARADIIAAIDLLITGV